MVNPSDSCGGSFLLPEKNYASIYNFKFNIKKLNVLKCFSNVLNNS